MLGATLTAVERAAILGSLGLFAWLIAFSRVYLAISQQETINAPLIIGLGLANGLFFLLNTAWLLRNLLKNRMRWIINNQDALCWLLILGAYACVLVIHQLMTFKPVDELLVSFMIIILSTLVIRFSAYLSIPLLFVVTFIYTLQIDHPDKMYIGAYIITQQLVLWSLGLGFFHEVNETKSLKVIQAQLKMAQSQLESAGRQEERQQISRDLHDKMGHDLAALNINLQISEHHLSKHAPHPQDKALKDAQNACQRLFKTLGIVVSDLRHQTHENFYDALLLIIDKVPGLKIELECDPQLNIYAPYKADNLLCCIQEALTNVLKHSNAQKVEVCISHSQGLLNVDILDDGNNAKNIQPGNGLRGMQERLSAIGGRVDCELLANQNVNLHITLPVEINP